MLEHLMKPKGIDGFWDDVHTFMQYLYRTYPMDMKAMEDEVRVRRENAFNKFAAGRGGVGNMSGIRTPGLIPDRLLMMLDTIYKKEYPVSQLAFRREFLKRYPKFRIADKI